MGEDADGIERSCLPIIETGVIARTELINTYAIMTIATTMRHASCT
jgi:hypothetical protein